MKTYIYVLKLNPKLYDDKAWTKEDHEAVESHYLRLKTDFFKGFILHVGRTEDPKNDGFGIVIFHADTFEEAEDYMRKDPAVMGSQMEASVFEYKSVFHR